MENPEWRGQIERERREKDEFLARDGGSPLSPADRGGFAGLDYFAPDPGYRFELELLEHKQKQIVRTTSSKGGEQEFLRWGEFRFGIDGAEYVLQAYKEAPFDSGLFILFRDATCGKETYGAGRYLDLEAKRDRTTDGRWLVDFNRAYNPWCAYSDDYACPMVPGENWLDVSIAAGERYPYRSSG